MINKKLEDNKLLETPAKHLSPKRKSIDVGSISSESLDKYTAYLLGVYLTDGSLPKGVSKEYNVNSYSFSLKTIDFDFADRVLSFLKERFVPETKAIVRKQDARPRAWPNGKTSACKPQFAIDVGFTKFAPWFLEQTGSKHHIPMVIWDAPLDIRRWFIAGVMDGDGYIAYHTRPDSSIQWTIGIGDEASGWIYEFRELLHKIGVGTNKSTLRKRDGESPFLSFNIKPIDFVSHGLFFALDRKKKRLETYKLSRNVQRLEAVHPKG